MPLKIKRWDECQEPDDGFRLLICRYRPRGVRKEDEAWDEWCKHLGPSPDLHAAFYGKRGSPISWEEYRVRYLEEMKEQKRKIRELADRVAAGKTITLLCSTRCTEESRCHRSLLKKLVEQEIDSLPEGYQQSQ